MKDLLIKIYQYADLTLRKRNHTRIRFWSGDDEIRHEEKLMEIIKRKPWSEYSYMPKKGRDIDFKSRVYEWIDPYEFD